ncbi:MULTISPECIES: UPF0236 family transposase-like protein [Anoxybacillus]|uniref:UPF0236 family transposase-like protein n=2 Tax=Anoxybacillaceae TaxID=3120669 RepID=UPI001FCB4F76|nr:UPF0236 family protein [Anoxybacillus flavithermus]
MTDPSYFQAAEALKKIVGYAVMSHEMIRQLVLQATVETHRPMGSAEGTMHVFAKRVKAGRSWYEEGIRTFLHVMVAVKDGLTIQTWRGEVVVEEERDRAIYTREKGSQECRNSGVGIR